MKSCLFSFVLLFSFAALSAQTLHFKVSMKDPATQTFHVELSCKGMPNTLNAFKLPVWTPGYYQKMDYAHHVSGFRAFSGKGKELVTKHLEDTTVWYVENGQEKDLRIVYDVKAARSFVANPFLDSTHGYIVGAGVFMYPDNKLNVPVTVTIEPYRSWKEVATGLEPVAGKTPYTFSAPNYDILYDCPILIGNLDSLPTFYVKGIPHHFIGYKMGQFDATPFIADLQKMIATTTSMFGDIPYKHYTFLAIGPGMGGIEHLNSTTISFSGEGLNKPGGRLRTLNFLTHEYFHHYNVKRIRPIELGPFDYEHGNRTNLLWVSEGLSVYYEYMILKRAGLCTEEDVFNDLRGNIKGFEGKPGKEFQTLQQASYNTWSDGPFGNSGAEAGKTISYYEKGPAVGLLFDLAIRHATNNKKNLDDVMRALYNKYYLQKKRGFTEQELKTVIEEIAGGPQDELFDYIYSTKPLDYPKYLGYAGLTMDPGTYTISRVADPDNLQKTILSSWLEGK